MLRIYKKIHKFCGVLAHFGCNRWYFENTNVEKLWLSLGPEDQKLFFFNMADVHWDDMVKFGVYGFRTYFLKEDPALIPIALKRAQRYPPL